MQFGSSGENWIASDVHFAMILFMKEPGDHMERPNALISTPQPTILQNVLDLFRRALC